MTKMSLAELKAQLVGLLVEKQQEISMLEAKYEGIKAAEEAMAGPAQPKRGRPRKVQTADAGAKRTEKNGGVVADPKELPAP